MNKKIPIVYIEFLDHCSDDDWHDISDITNDELLKCYFIGFLLKENKDEYNVSPVITEDKGTASRWSIAKKLVTKFKVLKLQLPS